MFCSSIACIRSILCIVPHKNKKAIIYKEAFIHQEDIQFIEHLFGKDNLFEITRDEMYQMTSNVFSISEEVVVSDKRFKRLNAKLREWGITVEEVPFEEISKMGGLLRCVTMPLERIPK